MVPIWIRLLPASKIFFCSFSKHRRTRRNSTRNRCQELTLWAVPGRLLVRDVCGFTDSYIKGQEGASGLLTRDGQGRLGMERGGDHALHPSIHSIRKMARKKGSPANTVL